MLKDLTGQKFGNLQVIKRVDNDSKGNARWLCRCSCGNETITRGKSLRSGQTRSCGCLQKIKASQIFALHKEALCKDLTGMTFGRLTVITKVEKSKNGLSQWLCKCNCGNIKPVQQKLLLNGTTKSCGCLAIETRVKNGKLNGPENGKKNGVKSIIDLTDKSFGYLTVLSRADNKTLKGNNSVPAWLCRCVCGKKKVILGSNLRNNSTISCGCIGLERLLDGAKQYRESHKEDAYKQQKQAIEMAMKKLGIYKNTNISLIKNSTIDKPTKNSKTGYRGVYMSKGKYVARITFQKKVYCLGTYTKIDDAIEARKIAEREYFNPIIDEYIDLSEKDRISYFELK